jgi:hypothetical protein
VIVIRLNAGFVPHVPNLHGRVRRPRDDKLSVWMILNDSSVHLVSAERLGQSPCIQVKDFDGSILSSGHNIPLIAIKAQTRNGALVRAQRPYVLRASDLPHVDLEVSAARGEHGLTLGTDRHAIYIRRVRDELQLREPTVAVVISGIHAGHCTGPVDMPNAGLVDQ